MNIDRAKALADYEQLATNEFWRYYSEELADKLRQELKVLATETEPHFLYRSQGRAEIWEMLPRFADDLVARLRR